MKYCLIAVNCGNGIEYIFTHAHRVKNVYKIARKRQYRIYDVYIGDTYNELIHGYGNLPQFTSKVFVVFGTVAKMWQQHTKTLQRVKKHWII